MWTIRAVAVGTSYTTTFDDPNVNIPARVRPYITGLVDWLDDQHKSHPGVPGGSPVGQYRRGTGANDYVIEYRERPVNNLADAFTNVTNSHLLFCMSTSVGDAAIDYIGANNLNPPMVVISSDKENFEQPNVCVVSAERPQLIRQCLNKFKALLPQGHAIYALHRVDNFPSALALRKIRHLVTPVPVKDTDDPAAIVGNLTKATHGLLVLPADRFFAAGDAIVTAANPMPTYWTTPDWPAGSTGAFGYPQYSCGRYMAERVARIWMNNNQAPGNKDVNIPSGERDVKP
jgi:hypothetical protein